jgi:anti-anti-sigma factor
LETPAADRVCELVVERMTRAGYADDVTLLVAHRTGQAPPPLEIELPAVPGQLAPLRRVLNGWLEGCGAAEEDCWAVVGAVIEAVSNSIDHAYDGDGGSVLVRGELAADGRAALTISDHGRWRPPDPRPDGRGRGLVMMRAFMDTVQVETSAEGTTVLLDRPLHHPAVLATQPAASPPRSDIPFEVTVDSAGAVPQVTVAGPVDLASAEELRSVLRAASRGGALSLSVDLTRVTLLASVGVHLLYELTEEMLSDSRTLTLRAPDGSLAQQVIILNGLDKIVRLAGD